MLFFASFRTSINFRIYTPAFPIRSAYPQFSSYTYTIPFSNLIISLFPSLPIQASQVYVRIGFLALSMESLGQSVRCGLMPIVPQSKEFPYPYYTPTDSIIGTIFYFTTGLHGLHVIFGSFGRFIILFVSMVIFIGSHNYIYVSVDILGNSDNQVNANPVATPNHTLPERYSSLVHNSPRAFPKFMFSCVFI